MPFPGKGLAIPTGVIALCDTVRNRSRRVIRSSVFLVGLSISGWLSRKPGVWSGDRHPAASMPGSVEGVPESAPASRFVQVSAITYVELRITVGQTDQ